MEGDWDVSRQHGSRGGSICEGSPGEEYCSSIRGGRDEDGGEVLTRGCLERGGVRDTCIGPGRGDLVVKELPLLNPLLISLRVTLRGLLAVLGGRGGVEQWGGIQIRETGERSGRTGGLLESLGGRG